MMSYAMSALFKRNCRMISCYKHVSQLPASQFREYNVPCIRAMTSSSGVFNTYRYTSKFQFTIRSLKLSTIRNSSGYLNMTPTAVKKLNEIQRKYGSNKYLRISVVSGGCHGFKYVMELVPDPFPDDTVIEELGAKVSIEKLSLKLIKGSTIDYIQELIFTGFRVISNPNVKASCGCKVSFDTDL